MLAAYRTFFAQPKVIPLFAANFLGRMTGGMAPLGITLFLRSHDHGFGFIGLVLAVYQLSSATGGPLLGRAVDRFGQVPVLCGSALGAATGYVLLVGSGGDNRQAALAAVMLAGLLAPPLEPCLRSLWPNVLAKPELVATAYALDASLQEIIFIVGPLLIVLAGELAGQGTALLLTAALMLLGTAAYALPHRAVRAWRGRPHQPDWAGPLRSTVLRRFVLAMVGVGVGLGALNIGTVAYEEHVGQPGLSGVLLGTFAGSSLVGGLVYGVVRWRIAPAGRLPWLMSGSSLGFALMISVPRPALALVLTAAAGLFLSPVMACGFSLISEHVPNGTATEAFAWMATAVTAGNALGAYLAGLAVQQGGLRAVFVLPVVAALAAALVALTLGRAARGGPRLPEPRPVSEAVR
ncbi:MFS family permease [Streptomyces calvus]|uniref:MFS transporter n=1 Tax=Streptomyces calvus TaxID=67282 RepID=UPI003515BABC